MEVKFVKLNRISIFFVFALALSGAILTIFVYHGFSFPPLGQPSSVSADVAASAGVSSDLEEVDVPNSSTRLRLDSGDGVASMSNFDISVEPPVKGDAEPESLLGTRIIGSFEDFPLGVGETGAWKHDVAGGARASFEIVAGGANGSAKAMQVKVYAVATPNLWDIQLVHEHNRVAPHRIYNYSAWVKGEKGAEVSFAVESPQYLNIDNKSKILSGEWQQVAFEFSAEGDVVRTPVHFASPHNIEVTFLVDEITITARD